MDNQKNARSITKKTGYSRTVQKVKQLLEDVNNENWVLYLNDKKNVTKFFLNVLTGIVNY